MYLQNENTSMEHSSGDEISLKGERILKKRAQAQETTTRDPKYETLEYALFLCRGYCASPKVDHKRNNKRGTRLLVLDEAETPDFEYQIQGAASRIPTDGGAHIRVVMMNSDAGIFIEDRNRTYSLFEKHWAFNMRNITLLSSQLVSSYHSRMASFGGQPCLEICYNISEYLSYDEDNISSLESNLTLNASKPADMWLEHQYEPLYFRYNSVTGQSTYMLSNATRENRDLLNSVGLHLAESPPKMHPFTLHTVILSQTLATRTSEIDDLYRRLLWIETQIYRGSIFQDTNSERFTRYIQLSHKLSRNLITLEHRNQRDTCHIDRLLQDHARLWKMTTRQRPKGSDECYIDAPGHERVRDSLLCLKDFAADRERQIINLQRKTQIFITLLYNLITGHDSAINLRIASETANVSHEAKKDSTSMKIIAGVTMFYLPATFVCSLFGTNFVALDTSGTSEPNFVISKLWWLYFAFAIPLTGLTVVCFVVWRRWRGVHRFRAEQDKYLV
ncbi:hypothetical protein BGW36DRAFT_382415 [Talaromyces proteolyticus]|uniref:Uncharacterized protein n=1 Tax=Talaromyces proteolyticus TaxID=1131652 RepID=A0AAD4KLB6_9EURO|nr:uncharacterized protein BGW36DRAFT_382415 [Talaromyces proteolyticus]KAH8695269.1 hypothetical protein BGW36DRAFT_382415 [Talaromyces proteolyticus]